MNFAMLDVAIGLVLLYLLLSLVCSALVEAINHLCNRRGAMLETQLERVMGRASVAEFRRLPGFAALATRGEAKSRSGAPALQPPPGKATTGWAMGSRVVALARAMRLRIVAFWRARRWFPATSRFPSYIPSAKFAEIALAWHEKHNRSREWCDDHEFGRMLTGLSREVGDDRALSRHRIAEWFDQTMARTSGKFKAQTNLWYAAVALTLVLVANADSIRLANEIYRNPAIQSALVEQAQAAITEGRDAQAQSETLRNSLQQFPLLGWPEHRPDPAALNNPWQAFGYLITVLALMMGADFWFNALQKLIRIRTSLKPDEAKAAALAAPAGGAEAAGGAPAVALAGGGRTAVAAIALSRAEAPLPVNLSARAPAFARISAFAYDRGGQLPANLRAAGYLPGVQFGDTRTGTQGVILEHAEYRVLAFRGTEPGEFVDIETDLKKALIAFPKTVLESSAVRVHQGFADGLASVWASVTETLRSGGETKPLIVTGHSLGGALAVLAAYALRQQKAPFNVQGVYTYGQPRAGDSAFAEDYDRLFRLRHWRMVNHRDAVPRLPPRAMGFRHTGRVLYLGPDGQPSIDPSCWFQLLDLVPIDVGMDWSSQVREYAADHAITAYVDLLSRLDNRGG